ncbi:MAG TPA: phytanoyl-CoA dioxygenase family protein [Steroidobacteraceae bacterium]|nr:phytanoyl-CoA dioxygenase family protein [Steroidobacteraceae bacterium]
MNASIEFSRQGFVILPRVVPAADCESLAEKLATSVRNRTGSRRLLERAWCRELGNELRRQPELHQLLPAESVVVQCSYFAKSGERDWLVAFHQDLSIAVKAIVADTSFTGWSQKEGVRFVQPPVALLRQLVAVRVHLDDSNADNGALRVIPGSHKKGRLTPEQIRTQRQEFRETLCVAPQGSVLAMRPLLLHASSKQTVASPRRVLHFVFGPPSLPAGLQWHEAV